MKNNFFNEFIPRLYKKNPLDSRAGIGVLIAVVIVAFVLLEFRSPLLLLSPVRDMYVHQLVATTQQKNELDIQQLWELRDKFGATITYNPDYLEPHSILQLKDIPNNTVVLLTYAGKGVMSAEYLVPSSETSSPVEKKGETIYKDSSSEISLDREAHQLHVYTNLPFAEMKKHNGMIDYNQTTQDLSNYRWFTQTTFDVSPNFKI